MVPGLFPSWFVAFLCEPGYVPDFNDLTLLPFCVGLTLLGLIGSWAAWRRRGLASGVRGVAWSLLPVSLYMTGLLKLLWDIVKSAVTWVTHLIFSPTVWAGVALFGFDEIDNDPAIWGGAAIAVLIAFVLLAIPTRAKAPPDA